MKTPIALELNYLTAIILLNYFNEKVLRKAKASGENNESYKINHPAYLDVTNGMTHLAIISARELYEANYREGLSDNEWFRLKEFRDSIIHAKKIEDQQIRKIASIAEVFEILNKLNRFLYSKYDLDKDNTWKKYLSNYYKDLDG
jgi:hypothetical protein